MTYKCKKCNFETPDLPVMEARGVIGTHYRHKHKKRVEYQKKIATIKSAIAAKESFTPITSSKTLVVICPCCSTLIRITYEKLSE